MYPIPTLFDKAVTISIATFFALLVHMPQGEAAENYQWVQYTSEGLEARVITQSTSCPTALVDGVQTTMTIRAGHGANYPVTVCALPLPSIIKTIAVGDQELPLPKSRPQRILLLGDTGCRLKRESVQACNDPVAWPFRVGSHLAAATQPDLIIHVGDFHYRETPCPENNAGCVGSPFGDNWDVWQQDFFSPVGKLLESAPWVMVRGNHEECERGGKGWARTLDPYPWAADSGCLGSAAPYLVDLVGITLAVMDVSTAAEDAANQLQATHFSEQYAALAHIDQPVWVAQHRPILALDRIQPELAGDNKTLALAAKQGMPSNVQTILSGHHHAFEILDFANVSPIQVVAGNGGDELSFEVPVNSDGLVIDGVKVNYGRAITGIFGYSLLERGNDTADSSWTLSSFDYNGKLLMACELQGRAVVCQ
jgi:Calcineurin-like phosphoesterase